MYPAYDERAEGACGHGASSEAAPFWDLGDLIGLMKLSLELAD